MTVRFYPESDAAQVFGVPGVYWQQRGHYFTRDGRHVPGDPDRDREMAEIRAKLEDPATPLEVREGYRRRLATLEVPPLEPEPEPVKEDMRLAENKRLKAMVEQYGGEWKGAAHARLFLEGKAE